MSKRKRNRRAAGQPATRARRWRSGRKRAALVALALCVAAGASTAALRWEPLRRAVGLPPLAGPLTPQQQGSLSLSKEYIYAGGRLVATEEPTPAATPTPTPSPPPSGPAPTDLVATAASASAVSLAWTAPAAAVTGYVVERRGPGSQTVEVSTGSTSAFFNDSVQPGDFAYLYRVKAVYGAGFSGYSNQDLATTVVFTDSPSQGATIKAAHITELRRAVNAVRALVPGLGAATWTYPDPVSAPASQRRAVRVEDVSDLRTMLDQALGPLGLSNGYPASPPLAAGALITAQHFEQIRAKVR